MHRACVDSNNEVADCGVDRGDACSDDGCALSSSYRHTPEREAEARAYLERHGRPVPPPPPTPEEVARLVAARDEAWAAYRDACIALEPVDGSPESEARQRVAAAAEEAYHVAYGYAYRAGARP